MSNRIAAAVVHKPTEPGLYPGEADLTKMFHVKHFGPIGAKNLRQRSPPTCKTDRYFGAIRSGAATLPR
jgi:hypothetical protein